MRLPWVSDRRNWSSNLSRQRALGAGQSATRNSNNCSEQKSLLNSSFGNRDQSKQTAYVKQLNCCRFGGVELWHPGWIEAQAWRCSQWSDFLIQWRQQWVKSKLQTIARRDSKPIAYQKRKLELICSKTSGPHSPSPSHLSEWPSQLRRDREAWKKRYIFHSWKLSTRFKRAILSVEGILLIDSHDSLRPWEGLS